MITGVPIETTSPSNNSYVSLSAAETIMAEIFSKDGWAAASDSQKSLALVDATRRIDRLNFIGQKSDADQVLQFPRLGDSTVPEDIKIATCLTANSLLEGVDLEKEYKNLKVLEEKFESIMVKYDPVNSPEHILAGIPSREAWIYIKPFVRDPKFFRLERVS